uniref:Uncharacterized protein n=1 Tax=Anguilla anguilla TaxID=7936 RepID=A0A0E9UA47_ANGAN
MSHICFGSRRSTIAPTLKPECNSCTASVFLHSQCRTKTRSLFSQPRKGGGSRGKEIILEGKI